MIDVRYDQQRHRCVVHQLASAAAKPEGGHIILFLAHDDHHVHPFLLAPFNQRLGDLTVYVEGGGGVADPCLAAHADRMVELDVDCALDYRSYEDV